MTCMWQALDKSDVLDKTKVARSCARSHRMNVCRCLTISLCIVLHAPLVWGQVQEVDITVGQGWALVRELRSVSFMGDRQDFLLPGIPEEADISSLMLRLKRAPLAVDRWSRESTLQTTLHPSLLRLDDDVVWFPADYRDPPTQGVARPIRCHLATPLAGRQVVEIVYKTAGLSWDASYSVGVQGRLENEQEPVSVDLVGAVSISNGTSRTFENATVHLVGPERREVGRAVDDLGFLMLTPYVPLVERWVEGQKRRPMEHVYVLPERVTIGNIGRTEAALASTLRIPASRVYKMNVSTLTLGSNVGEPLRKVVQFENSGRTGLGRNLPAGEVSVYLGGGARSRLLQKAWLPHTAAGRTMLVDLGVEPLVVATFRRTGGESLGTGEREESFQITVHNGIDSPVQTDIVVKPSDRSRWKVVSSNEPYDIDENWLRFQPKLEPSSQGEVQYKVRVE